MPLFYDPSEYATGSTMPAVDGIAVPNLERDSGADFVISPLDFHRAHTPTQLALHIANGAQLVQVKRLGDFPASVGYRLNDSLERMQRLTVRASQCALLVVGVYWGRDEQLWYGEVARGNDKPYAHVRPYTSTHTNYKAVVSAYNAWTRRGGCCLWPCPSVAELPTYLHDQLTWLGETTPKVVYPPKPTVPHQEHEVDGLQMLVRASPMLRLLVAIPDIGIELAKVIIDHYKDIPGITILDMLAQLSSPAGNHPRGWGPKRQANLARALGITNRQPLAVDNETSDEH